MKRDADDSLNPLVLVTADVDWLPLYYMYVPNGICIKYFDYGGPSVERVSELCSTVSLPYLLTPLIC